MDGSLSILGAAPAAFVAAFGRPEAGRRVDDGYTLRFFAFGRELVVLFCDEAALAILCQAPPDDADPSVPSPLDLADPAIEPSSVQFNPCPMAAGWSRS